MEKCTYCVQRITNARIDAENEGRRIRDGEVRTACQAACPTNTIIFGDLDDPQSPVAAAARQPQAFVLLDHLNTRPRTNYLAHFDNLNPELEKKV
jgi:molybdopterin-containing oxidoreductase family iron-sulfur binding subunit